MPPQLTQTEREAQGKIYNYLDDMMQLKSKNFPHFSGPEGQRSFLDYIDDSEKILNGFTLSREEQGKEEWQSNMLDNIARAKLRAVAAGVGLKVPEMSYSAVNNDGIRSTVRANIFKNITRQSFKETNQTLQSFLEIWQLLAHGTVFEYEGYKTGGIKQKRVKSFDSITGAIETEEKYVKYDSKPISTLLSPQEFFWWDMEIRYVQDQPRLAWLQYYTKQGVEIEFGKFKNFKYLKDKKEAKTMSKFGQDTTYYQKWADRVETENDYEVLRYYSKEDDAYEVWINGVPIIRAPLLWGEKEKYYPFAKTIGEPFANTNFFVGMSLPGILEAYQDAKNTVINTLIDKLSRSITAPMLIGLQNRDIFDVMDAFQSKDGKYYVPDINAVREMPYPSLNTGEMAMLSVLDRGLNLVSIDPSQQGATTGGKKTATESAIADKRATEIKSILYMALEDLWYQKTKLRTRNIQTHYIKDISLRDNLKDRIISVNDFQFPDGSVGTLDIHIARSKKDLLSLNEIEAREQAMAEQKQIYKIVSIPGDWFENYEYSCRIIPESIANQEKTKDEESLMKEIQKMVTLFPDFFVANKEDYLRRVLALQGKTLEDYKPPVKPQPQEQGSLLGLEQPAQTAQPLTAQPAPQSNAQ